MRIISKFHDYYDTALSFGVDPSLIYVRNEQEFEIDIDRSERKIYLPNDMDQYVIPLIEMIDKFPTDIPTKKGKRYLNIEVEFIGFCGKIYPYFRLEGIVGEYRTFYSLQSFMENVTHDILKYHNIDIEFVREVIAKHSPSGWRSHFPEWDDISEPITTNTFDPLFIGLGVPIFKLVKHRRVYSFTLNPCLKKDQFIKIKPPFEAFQEISMYLGNQLVRTVRPEPENVSDKYMIEKKGFDKKWSFRKHKDEIGCKK